MNGSFDYEEWFVGEIKQALEETEAGQLVDHETVAKRWERKPATEAEPSR